ncbi:hypothetical protein [Candidatus Hecatella orcuttiae]|nr:hypothetical protein [Candidatus Hecatella orcuttiae]
MVCEEVSILGKHGTLGRKSYLFNAYICSSCRYTEFFLQPPKS